VVCHHHSGLPSSQPKVYFLNSQHDSCEQSTVNLSQKRDSSTNPNVATGIPTFAQGIHLLPAKLCDIEKWYHQFLVGEEPKKFKRESHRVTYDSPLILVSIHCKMWIYRDVYCILSYRSPAAVSRNLCPENPAATKWDPNKISWALEVGFSPNFSKLAKKQKCAWIAWCVPPWDPDFQRPMIWILQENHILSPRSVRFERRAMNGVTREMKGQYGQYLHFTQGLWNWLGLLKDSKQIHNKCNVHCSAVDGHFCVPGVKLHQLVWLQAAKRTAHRILRGRILHRPRKPTCSFMHIPDPVPSAPSSPTPTSG